MCIGTLYQIALALAFSLTGNDLSVLAFDMAKPWLQASLLLLMMMIVILCSPSSLFSDLDLTLFFSFFFFFFNSESKE